MSAFSKATPLLVTVLTLFNLFKLTIATCYWQNSTLAPNDPFSIAADDTACFPSQDNSPCCGTGWSCLSNGVCYIKQDTAEFYYRGTCTDKSWNSQQCPGWCFAQNSNTSIPLQKCKKATGEDWYCCPGDVDCNCDTGKDAIKLGASQPVTVTVVGSTSWPGYVSTSVPLVAGNIASGGTSSRTATDTTSAIATGTSTSGTIVGVSATATGTTTGVAAMTSAANSTGSNNTALAAGLGAGIGIGVILIGAGALLLLRRSKRRRTDTAAAKPPYGHYSSPSSPPHSGMSYGPISQYQSRHQEGPPMPGEGYYATSAINEKDGRRAFQTQELPVSSAHTAQNTKQSWGRLEMDGNAYANASNTQGRVELA